MYSHVATTDSRELVFLAGQLPVADDGSVVGVGDFAAQMQRVFECIGLALGSVELGFDDVLAMTTYLTDRSSIEPFFDCRREIFPGLFADDAYPPNTLLIVNGLVFPECLIEVQVVGASESGADGER